MSLLIESHCPSSEVPEGKRTHPTILHLIGQLRDIGAPIPSLPLVCGSEAVSVLERDIRYEDQTKDREKDSSKSVEVFESNQTTFSLNTF